MKIQWESDNWPGARIEPGVTFLSWIPLGDGNDNEHGLLGVGSESGSVGITVTDLHTTDDDNTRYNYNLRGHHSAVRIITWNRAQCKLASCDTSGIIYVWVKNDDRWSVELVNDRGVKVNDLSWSPCGSSALICYEDNFVLIGSATGQRIWSNTFPTGTNAGQVNCGVWTPDSRQVVIGFSTGVIQVLSDQGANIAERTISSDAVTKLSFSPSLPMWTLAVLTGKKRIQMMRSYDEVGCDFHEFRHSVVQMQWNQTGTLLAVINSNHELLMLDYKCRLVHREKILFGPDRDLSALTWAHGDSTIIIAAGGSIGAGRILPGVPKLFDLVAYDLWKHLGKTMKRDVELSLPKKEMLSLKELDHHVIRCRVPRQEELHKFVCSVSDARVYCTIRPLTRGSHTYILCMEHMGGLVPLLVGRQVNRFLPQFYISLYPLAVPKIPEINGSSAQVEDATIIPRATTGRNSLWRRSKRHLRAIMSRHLTAPRQDTRLAIVNSNVWCTKFQISASGNNHSLPNFLGQVVYKTSVLHLQPRQMTITLAALFENEERQRENRPTQENQTEVLDVDTIPLLSHTDDGLTKEEKDFFEKVVSECTSLRAAMDAHKIKRNSKTHTSARPKTTKKIEKSTAEASKADKSSQNSSPWHEQIELLDFIDDADESALLPSTSKASSEEVGTKEDEQPKDGELKKKKDRTREQERDKKETDDIKAHIDKLASIAGQLRHRHQDFNSSRDVATMNKMKVQMKELLRRVNEIEKKVNNGDVRGEVRELTKTLEDMKRALGEAPLPSTGFTKVLRMHNKTPFWNEHNQVYQLDFGGRVTQESAKNFQVELDGQQVLQFGRIEGGAYTLDFRLPFTATQAFAVALASITQRLK